MIDLLRLCRLYYAIPFSYIHALTVCYALGDGMREEWMGIGLSSLAIVLVVSAGYVFNDVCDRCVDRVNAPERPIAAGRVRRREAIVWGTGLLATGLLVASMCRWQFLAGLVIVAAGIVSYDLCSKRLGIGKPLAVAVLMVSLYPLALAQAGGATGPRAGTLVFFPIWLFLTSFGYEGLKDIRDLRGDRSAAGGASWIHRHPRIARNLSLIAIFAGAVVLIGPYRAGCGWVYMTIASAAIFAAAMAAFLSTRRAMAMVYVECVIVGVAATADLVFLGP